jgi:hypothetical protein
LENLGSAFETDKPGPYQMMKEINGDDRWEPRKADLFQNVVLPLSLVCSLTYGNHLLGIFSINLFSGERSTPFSSSDASK